jgi:hypothetical protein
VWTGRRRQIFTFFSNASRVIERTLGYIDTTYFFFAVALRPNAGHGLLNLEVSRSHTQRRTTVGRTPLDE